ncbi:ATP synthase F1 subunit epsilon [uncultured Sunxiuqinia sp.]|uniref:ATP synthase F1 subunit epsilon n=1 Tax=uncultured Sunxiuqinia sp. TaxID=1573825 RepID=UPI0030DBAA9D|tara:strand:+ start:5784 stop:6026 length:243 start_codon:yes stop_codon:yes gene_type:complete
MFLEIITPSKKVFAGEVTLVQLPGTKGSFAVLENHAPLISTLEAGKIKVVEKGDQVSFFDIDGGVVEVKHNKIIVLTESA